MDEKKNTVEENIKSHTQWSYKQQNHKWEEKSLSRFLNKWMNHLDAKKDHWPDIKENIYWVIEQDISMIITTKVYENRAYGDK